MRIAVIKPDWRIRGGYEKVLGRIEQDLTAAGHLVDRVEVDVPTAGRAPFGEEVPPHIWDRSPEWFSHMVLLDTFRNADVSWADLVISTQPPSYAIDHPRHLALFYHHARIFYDLEQVYIDAGFARRGLHTEASVLLRRSEAADLGNVGHFLAGSDRVRERLRQFQGPHVESSLYQAPAPPAHEQTAGRFEHALCVSRHEFSKRTELGAVGMAMAGGTRGVLVGDGGRLPFVRGIAAQVAGGRDPATFDDTELWLNRGEASPADASGDRGTEPAVQVLGRVPDGQLEDLYRGALCVVAPALDEDDGLTVAEAMSHGKPVVVCRDGGGLTSLVQHGETGFVVEPTAAAIGEAISVLADDRALARRMGAAGRQVIAERTPARATRQLMAALETVMDHPANP